MNAPAIANPYGEAAHPEGTSTSSSLLANLTGVFRSIIDREPVEETPSYTGQPAAVSTTWQITAYGPVYEQQGRALWD